MTKKAFEFAVLGLIISLTACSSAKKKSSSHVELGQFEGKKIALMGIEGEPTAQKIAEVALINQLVQRGSFILIPKQEIEMARKAVEQDPMDWKGIAKKAGAEFALQVQVQAFDAPIHEGYSKREVVDSQLAEEQGSDGRTEQIFKVKSMDGHVKYLLTFTHLTDIDVKSGVAEAEEKVESSAQSSSIHLPPKLRFLEDLSNKAFREFFEKN